MKIKDMLKLAMTGMRHRKARTLLTLLGVIIGTVCIVLMVSVGLSSYRQFEEGILSDQSLTEITVTDYSQGSTGGIKDSTVQAIAALAYVKTASPVIDLPVTVYAGKYRAVLQVKGIDPEAIDVQYEEGRVFESGESVPALVCGGNTMQSYIDPENPPEYTDYEAMETYRPDIDLMSTPLTMILGDELEEEGANNEIPRSRQYRVRVSGITKQSYSESSYDTYMDLSAAKQILAENRELARYLGIELDSYTTVKIIVDDLSHVEAVLKEVKKLGYETYSPTESIVEMRKEQNRQQGQLFSIGFISLLVSAIGIANTMYANILERRRDIGVMKVVGMKIRWIRGLFMMEAALIGLMGGLLGIAVSYLAALVINTGGQEGTFLGMYFSEGMQVTIPPWLSAGALALTLAIGVLSGIYPACKATKMSALEAMRR